jgi:hypothetical protein
MTNVAAATRNPNDEPIAAISFVIRSSAFVILHPPLFAARLGFYNRRFDT